MKQVFALLAIALPAFAFAAGFDTGSTMTVDAYTGHMTVFCRQSYPYSGTQIQHFNCYEEYLNPGSSAYFLGEKGTGANKVDLVATHASGKVVDKSVGYDSVSGQTTKRVNLWTASLLQRPLLDMGMNHITYTLKNKDQVISQGSFDVEVKMGQRLDCGASSYSSSSSMDCSNPSSACSHLFFNNTYCK